MKHLKRASRYTLIAAIALAAVSCNNSTNKSGGKAGKTTEKAPAPAKGEVAIRYIDEDSIVKNYNLAKDFNEMTTRKQTEFDNAQKKKTEQLEAFQAQMQQKYKNNQYQSEQAMQADQSKLQQMTGAAQKELGDLQSSIQNELTQNAKQLQDSLDNFLKDYAKQKGYSVILRKASTLYIDESLDITDEVVEGLNKRYTKVAKK